MTADDIRRVLFDARPGAPEPSLLVWAAEVADTADLPALVAAAAAAARLDVPDGWPVIADAVGEVVARRVTDPATRMALLAALAVEVTGAASPAEACGCPKLCTAPLTCCFAASRRPA